MSSKGKKKYMVYFKYQDIFNNQYKAGTNLQHLFNTLHHKEEYENGKYTVNVGCCTVEMQSWISIFTEVHLCQEN